MAAFMMVPATLLNVLCYDCTVFQTTTTATRVLVSPAAAAGEWMTGKKVGEGSMHFENGDVYDGQWGRDKPQGNGCMTWAKYAPFVSDTCCPQCDCAVTGAV